SRRSVIDDGAPSHPVGRSSRGNRDVLRLWSNEHRIGKSTLMVSRFRKWPRCRNVQVSVKRPNVNSVGATLILVGATLILVGATRDPCWCDTWTLAGATRDSCWCDAWILARAMGLIRFRGYSAKGGYDGDHAQRQANAAEVH